MALRKETGHFPRIFAGPRIDNGAAPTAEEAQAANAGEYAPTGISKILQEAAKSKWTPIGIGTATGIAGYAAYQNIPAIHEFVNNPYHDLLQRLGLEIPTLPYFDNQADKGLIGDNNTKVITLQEAKDLSLQPDLQENNLNFLFPVQIPEGKKAQYARSLSFSGSNEVDQEAKANQVEDTMALILPKDSIISAPFNSHILAASRYKDALGDPNDAPWVKLFYYDPEKNLTYAVWIVAADDSDGQNHFYSYLPTQENIPANTRGTNWKKYPTVAQGQPILKTVKDNEIVAIRIQVHQGETIRPPFAGNNNTVSLANPHFYTQKDENGLEKLLVLVDEK